MTFKPNKFNIYKKISKKSKEISKLCVHFKIKRLRDKPADIKGFSPNMKKKRRVIKTVMGSVMVRLEI